MPCCVSVCSRLTLCAMKVDAVPSALSSVHYSESVELYTQLSLSLYVSLALGVIPVNGRPTCKAETETERHRFSILPNVIKLHRFEPVSYTHLTLPTNREV